MPVGVESDLLGYRKMVASPQLLNAWLMLHNGVWLVTLLLYQ